MSPSKATCCESSGIYDPTYQLCCQGKIYIMASRSRNRCCGDVMYDMKDNICCGEQVSKSVATICSKALVRQSLIKGLWQCVRIVQVNTIEKVDLSVYDKAGLLTSF